MKVTQYRVLILGLVVGMAMLFGAGCQSSKPKVAEKPREYTFWPPAPDEPRIQFLIAFNSSADVTPPTSRMDEVLYGRPKVLAIVKAYGVAMWQGKIYVCDVRSAGLTVLDLRKHLAKAVGLGGPMEIGKANDVAISPEGLKYVVDVAKHAIVVLDQEDHAIARFAPPDFNPVSASLYGNELFVADYTGQTIKVLNRATGELLRTIGQGGPDDGQFVRPLAVRVDPSGVVTVDDVLKSKVQRFTRDGKFLSVFGRPGNQPGDLVRPKHFAFDKNGYMYIADGGFSNVQVFDENQKVVGYFGSPGQHPGAMYLPVGVFVDESPEDIALFQQYVHPAFNAERLILVTNQFGNQRVSVYAGGRLKPGKTMADVTPARAQIPTGTIPAEAGATTQPGSAETMAIPEIPSTAPATSK